jgi:superfamily II DNA or RNA helicase
LSFPETFFQSVQKATLPGVWSKGVALSRENSVLVDSREPDDSEIILRIRIPNRPVSPKVSLWPEDEDWYCDCGDRNDPCLHIVAAVVALKNGTLASLQGAAKIEETAEDRKAPSTPELQYRFIRKDGLLSLERWITRGQESERLNQSLIRLLGGISSGRIAAPSVPVTQDDFAVDQILQNQNTSQPLERPTLSRLLPALKNCARIFLDGQPIRVSSQKQTLRARLAPENEGFRLSLSSARNTGEPPSETFRNGAVLEYRENGPTLIAVEEIALSPAEKEILSDKGSFFPEKKLPWLAAELLPTLQGKIEIDVSAVRLPERVSCLPEVLLKTENLGDETLSVTAVLVYRVGKNPPIAELSFTPQGAARAEYLSRTTVPIRDLVAEKALLLRLQSELHLKPDQPVRLRGKEAIEFTRKARQWNQLEITGKGAGQFEVAGRLVPRFSTDGSSFKVEFHSSPEQGANGNTRSADPARVFQAWRENASLVPLLGGGYAPLPSDWLNRYGARILALASQQETRAALREPPKLPKYFLPELAELCGELGAELPASLKKLTTALETHQGIPKALLPDDLKAELRSYQQEGINWLSFLRDAGMGAILADDMGLGKTLQALSAMRGKTLIVTPTSVLQSWAEQIERFRPGISTYLYHGAQRSDEAFSSKFDVVLTSYGILRLDAEKLQSRNWDTIILDEAQWIKNPESQIARAAHQLQGSFKMALSGTPVENRLEDLWSQFHFANPGLLGDPEDFKSDFIEPIARGNRDSSQKLRRKIRPFLLRRLKRDVAPQLPPRTEIVLHCELSSSEKDLYDSIMAATRKEVISQLETGGSIFAALEALLRLRQACCHPELVLSSGAPASGFVSSAKLELLLQSLENSTAQGHRALVFSQWTSLLDRIEPALRAAREGAGIRFSRLDGSTRNRAEVVQEFQAPEGPEVMLISLKAGGVGITLTAADHIYIMDPWWNPAVEDQAADRAHRIGQENPVFIHRLVAKDTVEERILALQNKKKELANAVLGDAAGAVSLSRDDLLELLK